MKAAVREFGGPTYKAKEFPSPKPGELLFFSGSKAPEPEGLYPLLLENWNCQLDQQTEKMTKEGKRVVRRPYERSLPEQPLDALYEVTSKGEKPYMWPGRCISYKGGWKFDTDSDSVYLPVTQTSFPMINGLKDSRISDLYDSQNIERPSPALTICTFARTLDGQLLLTIRGTGTTLYPLRFEGQGGSPESAETSIVQHQEREMLEEVFIRPDEIHSQFRFNGIVTDLEKYPGKPVLSGHVDVNQESGKIQERFYCTEFEDREKDSKYIAFAPATEGALADHLSQRTHFSQYTPTCHGGLVLFGRWQFGEAWADYVLKKIKKLK